jgi:hypothetical protein
MGALDEFRRRWRRLPGGGSRSGWDRRALAPRIGRDRGGEPGAHERPQRPRRRSHGVFADGRRARGKLLGEDMDGDLAVLEVDTAGAAALPWANAKAAPAIGSIVFAVASAAAGGVRTTSGWSPEWSDPSAARAAG